MRVIVTGGAGYVGSSLVETLLLNPTVSKVIVYDSLRTSNLQFFFKSTQSSESSKLEFIQGDILDTRSLERVLLGVDVVFHLAAHVTTPFADHDAHQFEQINHWGTASLVSLVERSHVQRFVYLSSASVYGASEQVSGLRTVPNPTTFYGISKLRGEAHVERLLDAGIQSLILRCGNVYGHNRCMRIDSVINNFMFRAHFNLRGHIVGDGTQHRAFVEVGRLGRAIAEVGLTMPASVYNLSERNLTVMEVVNSVRELYPDFETIHIDHGMPMRNLEVEVDTRLSGLLGGDSLSDDLRSFQSHLR